LVSSPPHIIAISSGTNVGSQSEEWATPDQVVPLRAAGNAPPETKAMTRKPPSHMVALPPRNGALVLWSSCKGHVEEDKGIEVQKGNEKQEKGEKIRGRKKWKGSKNNITFEKKYFCVFLN
jgi:hypothetical protein